MRNLAILVALPALCAAADLKPVVLPAPQTQGGKPLMDMLKARHSSREFDSAKLPDQVLSNLLWAADGINRPDGRRTAPTASNRQEVDVYVVQANGAYLYSPKEHRLMPVADGDLRKLTGTQDFVATAPVNLVFVADYARMGGGSEENKAIYSGTGVGFVSQNVYLFCTSEGLATVVRASVDKPALAKALNLRPEQHIVLAQTVGYPKK
jgi:SagB-type dehydrogenase family enzyme